MRQGANGTVRYDGNVATKTLKETRSPERLERFRREVEALRRARAAGIPNIVELLDADLDAVPPWLRMRRYAGDIDDLLPQTRNQPATVAKLMIPVARSLQRLASLPTPIYHRDLKPSNILYDGTVADSHLVLSDFGCAFLADPGAERMTAQHRAVGATFFRAPEYTHGRVEDVNATGDVFAIGKVLWYLCNGVPGEVFPYTLWFPEEYHLARRCTDPGVCGLNIVIGSCVAHTPSDRMSYSALISALERISEDPMPTPDEAERLRLVSYEAELQVRQQEALATFVQLLTTLETDLSWAADRLADLYGGTLVGANAHALARFDSPGDQIAHTVVVRRSDAAVLNWSVTYAYLHIHAHPFPLPHHSAIPAGGSPFIEVQSSLRQGAIEDTQRLLLYRTSNDGLTSWTRLSGSVPYSRTALLQFLRAVLSRVGKP